MEFSEGVNYTILVNNANKAFFENFESYKVLDTMDGFDAIKMQVEVFLSKRIVFNEIWYYLSKEEKSELLEILKRRNVSFVNITSNVEDVIYSDYVIVYDDDKKKLNYINEVYNALIIRDIQQKYNIQNIGLMDSLTEFMMDNISNLTSYRKIANKLNESNINTNDKTVANYIKYLCDAFAFYKIRRYDIQGKRYLSSVDKYYLVDTIFKYAKLGTKNINYGRVYENIVAIELLRRGYEVYVGELYNSEVDFVAMKRNEKLYIQVSDNISDDKTFEREVRPLLKIKDAYPKILIARTRHNDYQYEGVQIYDIANWLLK